MHCADLQELVELYRRRLLVPVERSAELADLLAPYVVEERGWLRLGAEQGVVTLWWTLQRGSSTPGDGGVRTPSAPLLVSSRTGLPDQSGGVGSGQTGRQ
jgi:hypothetical protein